MPKNKIPDSLEPSEKIIMKTILEEARNSSNPCLSKDGKSLIFFPDYDTGDPDIYDSIVEAVHDALKAQYKNRKKGYLSEYLKKRLDQSFNVEDQKHESLLNFCDACCVNLKKKYPFLTEDSVYDELFETAYSNTTTDMTGKLRRLPVPLSVIAKEEEINKYFSVKKFKNLPSGISLDDFNAMYYLVKSQGYKDSDFQSILDLRKPDPSVKNVLNKEQTAPFLKNVYEEIINCSSNSNRLVFLSQIELNDVQKIADNLIEGTLKYIKLNHNTVCGLYDPWNGGGSLMGINLPRDMSIPGNIIHTVAPDGFFGHSLKSIYGKEFDYQNAFLADNPVLVKKIKPENNPLKNTSLYLSECDKIFAKSLIEGNSVLLKEREGVDYSIDNKAGLPLLGLNQLMAQQIRNDYGYSNPNFSPYTELKNIKLKPDEIHKRLKNNANITHIFSIHDNKTKTNHEIFYFNHDQLLKHPKDYTPVKVNISHPYINCSENSNIDILNRDIHNYFASLYNGEKYSPSPETKNNNRELGEQLSYKVYSLANFCNQAQIHINKHLKNTKNNIITTKSHKKGRGVP